MRKIKLGLLAAASACMLAALPAQANLVVNGGFETGAFPPWVPDNATITSVAADVHSGTYAAQLHPSSSSITQPVPITAGTYFLDFWAKTDGAGILTVTLDAGAPVLVLTFLGASAYTQYVHSFTTLGPGDLRFSWSDLLTNSAFIDDVNLVPEPTTMIAGALLLLPFAASTLRGLRNRFALA